MKANQKSMDFYIKYRQPTPYEKNFGKAPFFQMSLKFNGFFPIRYAQRKCNFSYFRYAISQIISTQSGQVLSVIYLVWFCPKCFSYIFLNKCTSYLPCILQHRWWTACTYNLLGFMNLLTNIFIKPGVVLKASLYFGEFGGLQWKNNV